MSYVAALELIDDDSPVAVPRRLERASVALNHGLLIGEILDVDITDAQRALDAVGDREEQLLTDDEVFTLRDTYRAIRAALELALEPSGAAVDGPAGDRLRSSDLLEAGPDGVITVRHRRMPLPQLRTEIEEIERLLHHAAMRGGRVRLEPT